MLNNEWLKVRITFLYFNLCFIRLCWKRPYNIPKGGDIQSIILKEAHRELYFAHLGVKKMYADMKKLFFWVGMKHDVVHFVAKSLECQQVKADHHHPTGLLQPHDVPMSKWEFIYMDFLWDCRSHRIDTMSFL
jgi:hypothetical protein